MAGSRISKVERERRRRNVYEAVRENAIEGQRHREDVEPIFQAYINGEIEVTEMMPRLKALYAERARL